MREGDVERRAEMPARPKEAGAGSADGHGVERQARTACGENARDENSKLMEEVLRREDVTAAYERVVRNGGAPGVDGMTVNDLMGYCRGNAGASHLNQAISNNTLRSLGLVSFLDEHRRLERFP
jgi:hypothetical protein